MIEQNYNNIITLFKDGTLYVEPVDVNTNDRYNDNNIYCNDVISFAVYAHSFVYMTSDRNIFYVYDGLKTQLQPMTNDIPDTIIYYQKYHDDLILFGNQTVYYYTINDDIITLFKSFNVGSIKIINMTNYLNDIFITDDNRLFWIKNLSNDVEFIELFPDVDCPKEFISEIIDIGMFGADIMLHLKDQSAAIIKHLYHSVNRIINGCLTISIDRINTTMFRGKKYNYMPRIINFHNIYDGGRETTICFITEDNCLWNVSYINGRIDIKLVKSNIAHVYLAFIVEFGDYGFYHITYLVKYVDGDYAHICNGENFPWPFPQELVPIEYIPLNSPIYDFSLIMNDNSMYGLIVDDDYYHFERMNYYSERPLMPKQSMKIRKPILKSARTRDF